MTRSVVVKATNPAGDRWGLGVLARHARARSVDVVFVTEGIPDLADDGTFAAQVTGGDAKRPDEAWRWAIATPGDDDAGAVEIVVLANDAAGNAGPWLGLDAGELRDVFNTFARLVGTDWASSVGATAQDLILSTHPRASGGRHLGAAGVTPEPAQGSTLELPWQSWRRELTRDELALPFVHAYDANAQYLAAWGGAELGFGEAVHYATAPRFDRNSAGLWRIPSAANLRNINPLMPAPWLAGREWFTTPTITRLLEVVDGLDLAHPFITEAYVWPEHARYLRVAGERLRDARTEAIRELEKTRAALGSATEVEDAEQLAGRLVRGEVIVDAVKSLYRVQTGRFGMARNAGVVSIWDRPHWGHTIRALARVNLHRRLDRLAVKPFAIATDGLLFASDEPDGRAFAERIRLPLGRGLGQYRHEGTARLAALPLGDTEHAGPLFKAINDERITA